MFSFPYYSGQIEYTESPYQRWILNGTDAVVFARESSKVFSVVFVVVSASSVVFNFDRMIPLSCTVLSMVGWGLFSKYAESLEPSTQQMVDRLQREYCQNLVIEISHGGSPLRGSPLPVLQSNWSEKVIADGSPLIHTLALIERFKSRATS